jgi:D-alanyl-D-alanine carboxypeptidase
MNARRGLVLVAAAVLAGSAIGCGGSVVSAPVPTPQASAPPSRVRQALERVLAALHEETGASAVALVRSKAWTWTAAVGERWDDHAAQPGDRFGIASTTKTFTATVVLQLVGEGRLSLDDSLERWLPGEVSEGRQIKIRHLLNHTSGLGMFGYTGPLIAPPGTEHRYSNGGFILLGLVAEKVTGMPLDTQFRDRIFRALHMNATSFGTVPPAASEPELPPFLGEAWELSTDHGSGHGGIFSTASDLATFYDALLAGRLLDKQELGEMLKTVATTTDGLAGGATTPARAGLGIFGFNLPCGSPWGHAGDEPSYSNQVLASADESKVVVIAQSATGWTSANAAAAEMYCL